MANERGLRDHARVPTRPASPPPKPLRHGIARALSKLGIGSRTQAARWVREGRVRVNGKLLRDPDFPVTLHVDRIEIDDTLQHAAARVILMLNKPRGLITTVSDERQRDTVYRCLGGAGLPWLAPVGRLDKASEGLLLFSNDPRWAARIADPASGPDKTYHVQLDRPPDAALVAALAQGATVDGERLTVKSVRALRTGTRHGWLEIVLDEGRNRHIRRLLAAHQVGVLRLVRIAIGSIPLGDLAKGAWRMLTQEEIRSLLP
jgi:23S rRNA pseudouridine2605 synthase